MARAGEYRDLNIQARLSAGLLTVESWLRAYGVTEAGVTGVLEHMWQWLMVTSETFGVWYDFDSAELQAAEGGEPLRSPAALACQERGAPAADLADMLADVVSIVYDSLFGALDLALSLDRLRNVEAAAARSGIGLPDPERFSSFKAQDKHGWGYPVAAAQVAAWRRES
jgi:hypothetical protein